MTSNHIQFNGESVALESAQTVADLLEQQSVTGRFVVVINDTVVPKSNWQSHPVKAGDSVEIMSPISGG